MVRKKRRMTFQLKLEVINLIDSGVSSKDVQKTLGLLPYQIRDTLRYKDKILANKDRVYTSNANKIIREEMFPDLNSKICSWMRDWREAFGSFPANEFIKTKALELAKDDPSPKIDSFKASNGWIYKMRNKVSQEFAENSRDDDSDSFMASDFLDVRLVEDLENRIPGSEFATLIEAYKLFKRTSLKYDVEPDCLFEMIEAHISKMRTCCTKQQFK